MKLNYTPGSMSFAAGFAGPRGDVGYFMKADQEKAHQIIKDLISQGRKVEGAEMGLDGDWDKNSCEVYRDGEFLDYDAYSSSQWAEPIMIVSFEEDPTETYSVWTREEKPIEK